MSNEINPDAELRRQQADAVRHLAAAELDLIDPVLGGPLSLPALRRPRAARPAAPPKGHEAFLKALEASGATIAVVKVSGGTIVGVLRHSDKYTLTVRTAHDGGHRDRVMFKHDISEFYSLTPRKAADAA
jgi:glycine/D-amino acid oxidase-like deaminating enzyme